MIWSRSEIKIFFGVEYCGKKQIESGSSVNPQQILTTVMTNIVVDKSKDNAEPLSICKIDNDFCMWYFY